MADRFPLILNTSANQIQEIASGDTLDLTGSNIKGVGIITATNLSGNIIAGAGTSNIVSGILTAVAADIDDFVDVGSNIQLGNAGVITATTFKGDGDFVELDVDGHTNLDNVSIAGVTTISGDLRIESALPSIYLTDTNSNPDYLLYNSNGNFEIRDPSSGTRFQVLSSGTVRSFGNFIAVKDLDVDGHTNLDNVSIAGVATVTGNLNVGGVLTYEDVTNVDSVGLITARNGINVSGGNVTIAKDIDVDGHTNLDNVSIAGVVTATSFVGALTGNATSSDTIDITSDGSANTTMYPTFVNGNGSGKTLRLDSGLSYVPSTNILTAGTFSGSGASLTNLNGSNIASGTVPVARIGTGTKDTTTFYRGDGTFQVVSTDLVGDSSPQLGGDLDTNSYHILLDDSHAVKWGNNTELEIQHTGSSGYGHIHNSQGNFIIDTTAQFYVRDTSGSNTSILANPTGATTLYFNNTPKLLTEQGGINVKSPGSDWNNIERTSNGYYGFAFRKEDGSSFNGYLGFTGGGSEINNTSAAQDLVIRSETNIILSKGYSTRLLKTDSNGAVSLYYGNGEKFYTSPNGISITGFADATGNSARFRTIESGGASVEIRSGGSEGYIGTQTGHKISFITNASRAMTLLNDAEHQLCVGIKGETGDTSPTSTVGWALTGGWTKGVFSGSTGSNTPWTLYNQHSNYNRYMAYVRFDGGVMSHQSNDGNLCDERIKQDFGTVSSQWNNIKNIGLKTFRYKNEPSDAKLKVGVIAQQVETIYPDLVDEDWPIGDANPNTHEKNSGDFYKSVKEEQLQMYTLKALQEAMARIETLEAEVAALKGS